MTDLQYNFLDDTFTTYKNVESPKVKLQLPLGEIDLEDKGLYIGNNGTILANNNIPERRQAQLIINNNEEVPIIKESPVTQQRGDLQENKKKAMEFFQSKGLSTHAAMGLVGNLLAESSLNPSAVNKKSGAIGIAQWLGGRKKALIAKYGNNPTFEQQLDFVWEELNSSHKKGLEALKNSRSIEEAAANAFGWFEFSVGPKKAIEEMQKYGQDGMGSYNQRIKFAKSLKT